MPQLRMQSAARAFHPLPFPAAPLPKKPLVASPLMICDQLISLAQNADRAGLAITAEHLVHLALSVFDEQPGCARRHGSA